MPRQQMGRRDTQQKESGTEGADRNQDGAAKLPAWLGAGFPIVGFGGIFAFRFFPFSKQREDRETDQAGTAQSGRRKTEYDGPMCPVRTGMGYSEDKQPAANQVQTEK